MLLCFTVCASFVQWCDPLDNGVCFRFSSHACTCAGSQSHKQPGNCEASVSIPGRGYICGRLQPPHPPGKGKGPPPLSCGFGWGASPPPVGVGWVVGVRLVSGFISCPLCICGETIYWKYTFSGGLMLSKAWYLQVGLHVCSFCCWLSRMLRSCLGCSVAAASCPTDA